jgi:hypothetical protein
VRVGWRVGLSPPFSSKVLLRNCVRASESTRRPSPLSCTLPKRESEACVEVTTYYASLEYSLLYGRTPSLPYIYIYNVLLVIYIIIIIYNYYHYYNIFRDLLYTPQKLLDTPHARPTQSLGSGHRGVISQRA